jgi:competence protein ComEA
MRKWLNLYFDLSRGELNGLLTMVVLIFLIAITPRVYVLLRPDLEDLPSEHLAIRELSAQNLDGSPTSQSPFQNQAQFQAQGYAQGAARSAARFSKGDELGYFDPNVLSISEWQQLGLSEKQARSVQKYLNKGGRFNTKEDLQKMYTISPKVYERIAPYVRIAEAEASPGRNVMNNKRASSEGGARFSGLPYIGQSASPKKAAPIIEINLADSLLLEEIRGIGPAFARRIIKYRERLGGFCKKEQLREVFGLDSTKYEAIKNQVRVDASFVRKINVNTLTFEELRNHPYLKYKQINAIIQYRKQHGPFRSAEDLSKIVILEAETLNRLSPYLSF